MKKEYVSPEMMIIQFEKSDVITTSGPGSNELPDIDPEVF